MLPDEVIARLRAAPTGARWRKVALQVNPFSYRAKHAKVAKTKLDDEDDYNAALVVALTAASVEAIAITDHDCVASGTSLMAACTAAGITAFPGAEISAEDVHLLCIADPVGGIAAVETLLGWQKGEASDGGVTVAKILARAADLGLLVVPAHADAEKGLFALKGQHALEVLRSRALHAVATKDADLKLAQQAKLKASGRVFPLAVIGADDIWDPVQVSQPRASTWFRMGALDLRSLTAALCDPDSRMRATTPPAAHRHIRAVTWEGGYLDGQTVGLSEAMSVLIGGRGAGKSTVVESIRFAFDVEPATEAARASHTGVVRGVLGEGTRVSVLVDPGEGGELLVLTRTVGEAAQLVDLDGHLCGFAVPFGIEAYAQKELGAVGDDPSGRSRMLRRFAPLGQPAEDEVVTASKDVRSLSLRLGRELAQRDELADQQRHLPALQERLEKLRSSGIDAVADAQTAMESEAPDIRRADEILSRLQELPSRIREGDQVDVAFLDAKIAADPPSAPLLARLRDVLTAAGDDIEHHLDALGKALALRRLDAAPILAEWDARRTRVKADYDDLLRSLAEPMGVKAFVQAQADVHRVLALEPLLREAQDSVARTEVERNQAIHRMEKARDHRLAQLDAARSRVSRLLGNDVRVLVTDGADRAELRKVVKALPGRTAEIAKQLDEAPGVTAHDLAEACLKGASALVALYQIPRNQAEQLADLPLGELLALESVDLRPKVDIELNLQPDPTLPPVFRPLDQLSVGQRATTLLRLLLIEGSAPLLIDQPEDDLDNAYIHDRIVGDIRREKARRQLVFSTHNANIPVLGDAEMLHVLEPDRSSAGVGRGTVVLSGSIDDPKVARAASTILEGGEEAFRRRYRRYGFTTAVDER